MIISKKLLDERFPKFSRNYRLVRDYLHFISTKRHHTELGFDIYGDADLASSRSDSHEIATFNKLMTDADVVIDIGANVGLYTCIAALAGKQVLAVEPHPQNLRCLYRNLECNNINDVEIFPLALSDCTGLLPLFGGRQGATLLSGWGGIRSNYQNMVAVNTLDNICRGRFESERLLIKMDVEGNEYHVLRGALELLASNNPPAWMIEHGLRENFADGINPNFLRLFELFWSFGYQAATIEQESRQVTREDVSRWVQNGKRDFGDINFIFTHTHIQSKTRAKTSLPQSLVSAT